LQTLNLNQLKLKSEGSKLKQNTNYEQLKLQRKTFLFGGQLTTAHCDCFFAPRNILPAFLAYLLKHRLFLSTIHPSRYSSLPFI